MVIGGVAGLVSRTLTAPLELYKIQRQNTFVPNSTISDVLRKEGLCHLWKGNGTNCLRIFPQTAISYAVFTSCDTSVFREVSDERFRRLLSGSAGGCISMILTYPLETIRSRLSLQTRKSHYRGMIDAYRRIPIEDLYKGLRMSILGFAPFTAISFSTYFSYRDYLESATTWNQDIIKVIAGGLSGVTAISVTYPTDLIRRRLQLQNFDSSVPRYTGIVDCVRKILATEGGRGLYRGLLATYMKLFPTIGIQFLVMERLKAISQEV